MSRSTRPRPAAPARPSGSGVRVHDVSDLRAGDVVEVRTWDTVHCRGEVDAVCPQLGVLWVLDGSLGQRTLVDAREHTIWRLSRHVRAG